MGEGGRRPDEGKSNIVTGAASAIIFRVREFKRPENNLTKIISRSNRLLSITKLAISKSRTALDARPTRGVPKAFL